MSGQVSRGSGGEYQADAIGNNTINKNAFRFVKNICDKLDEQIIFITGKINNDAMEYANKIISVSQKNMKSEVTYIK